MTRILDLIHVGLKFALGLLVAALLVPVTIQIVSRFVDFIPGYVWTEEVARFCFIWMVMIGAMCAVRDSTHFDVEVLPESADRRVEAAKRISVHLMVFVIAAIFIWYGWKLVLFGWYQTSEMAAVPMNWVFVAWPIMGIVSVLFLVEKIIAEMRLIRGKTS